VSFRAR